MIPGFRLLPLFLLTGLAVCAAGRSAPPEAGASFIDPAGLGSGALVLHGGGAVPDEVRKVFLDLAGKEKAKLVIIPTANADAGRKDSWDAEWAEPSPTKLTVLHAKLREQANDPKFIAPLKGATAVWFPGGDQQRLADAYAGTLVEKELQALLRRGGVIGGTSAGAAAITRLMIAGGTPPEAKVTRGLDLLPGAVVDQHFVTRQREPRLVRALETHPGHVGFGIDEGTAIVVRGRSLQVIGKSTVTVLLRSGAGRPARRIELKDRGVSDLTMLRKAALGRAQPPYPPATLPPREVPGGSLVIVGGGGLPREVLDTFIELAGGKNESFVVLPTSMPDPIPQGRDAFLRRAGVKNVHVLPGRTRDEVGDPKVLDLLDRAKGVWFDGGRQWRFVDAYEGTPFEEKLRGVLKRGGVIGGSSAGATIQGDYLCRGSPLGPNEMMCEGYERGFGYLPGVAIDQHFTQRNRFADLAALKKKYPQYLGIGLDEATAIIVKGTTAKVMGRNKVHFYTKVPEHNKDCLILSAGEMFDLKTLTKIE